MRSYQYTVEFKERGADKAQRMAKGMDGLDRSATKTSISIDKTSRSTSTLASELTSSQKSIGKTSSVLGGLKRAALGVLTVTALLGTLTGASKLGGEMESLQVSFETMLGSAEKGQETIRKLNQFSNVTPFTNDQVLKSSKSLLAYNIEAKELIPTLETLGNIAAGVGMDKMPNLILAFGQVKAATKLTGMELRQFTEAGVPLLDELSKVTGKSVAVIKEKLIPAGEIGFSTVKKALEGLSQEGGRFFRLMDRQSVTFSGRMSTLKGKMQLVSIGAGEGINNFLKPAINQAIDLTDSLLERMKPLDQQYKEQKDTVRKLSDETRPLIDRFEELAGKAKLNKEEQKELKTITKQLSDDIPSAVTRWNKFGEAIGLNTDRLKEFIDLNKDALKELNRDSISKKQKEIASLSRDAALLQGTLNANATRGGVAAGRGSTLRALSDEEIRRMSGKLNAISGRNGLIDKLKREIAQLSGESLGNNQDDENAAAGGSGTGDVSDLTAGLESITAGGSKSITINMPGIKFAENFEVVAQTLDAGVEDVEAKFREMFVRILNSGLQTTTQF